MENNIKCKSLNHLSDYGLPMAFKSSRHQSWSRRKLNKISSTTSTTVEKLFNKQIEIHNNNYQLPCIKTLFTEDAWQVEDLQKIKEELNSMKNKLNDVNIVEWRLHTKKRNYAEDIKWRLRKDVNPEFLTQAWCKFYELVSSFPLIPEEKVNNKKLKTVHLCEAPGAFVASLNHWLKLNRSSIDWNWTATTLNPYYEGNSLYFMLNDDRFIMHTLDHWYFGADNTGNLMKEVNLDGFVDYEQNNRNEIMLITADGSIDCIDVPDEQEAIVFNLHFCETITALNLLCTNGNFLLKVFTIFEYKTICLVYLLSCCFNQIFFKKPATSKAGNSEVYVICLNFKGFKYVELHLKIFQKYFENNTQLAMFRKCDIPQSFIKQIVNLGEYFKSHQCEVILNNIRTFNSDNDEYFHVKRIRKAVADYYVETYKLNKLPVDSMKIVNDNKLLESYCQSLHNKISCDSYNERQKKDKVEPVERLLNLIAEFNCLRATNNIYFLQYKNNFEDLRIIKGASYKKIQSSKFCDSHLLKCYNSIIKLKNEMRLNWQYPDEEALTNFTLENNNVKILSFHYGLTINNFNVITKVYEMLMTLEDKDTLIFLGFSFLTQFNVGLVYTLAHAFEHVKMQLSEELGCIITFCGYAVEKNIIKSLENILEASIDAEREDNIVLSIIPIIKLYEDKMYRNIVETNHLIIKYFAQQIEKFINNS